MHWRVLTLALGVAAGPAGARAQPPAQTTPGTIVLLANSTDASASDMLRRALRDPEADVRRAAARVVSVSHAEVIEAVREALQTETDADVITELVRTVMALGGAPAERFVTPYAEKAGADGIAPIAEWFARMDATMFAARLGRWVDLRGGPARIAPIVRLATLTHPAARDVILQAWQPLASPAEYQWAAHPPSDRDGESILQTPSVLAAHFLRDTLAVAHCSTQDDFIAAQVTFGADGRPHTIVVPDKSVTPACLPVLTAIARLSIADDTDPVQHPHDVVIPMWKDFIACTAQPYAGPAFSAETPPDGFHPVRLVNHVAPVYPRGLSAQPFTGVVQLQGVVSSTGCVVSARMVSGPGALALPSFKALLKWRFDPARLADRAVPMLVDVELTFEKR